MRKTAVIYSNRSQECERMAQLLKALPHVDEFHEYFLGKHFTETAFMDEFGPDATFPQVSLGYEHLGNMKETLQYLDRKGMLL